jgi:hypothetical protein
MTWNIFSIFSNSDLANLIPSWVFIKLAIHQVDYNNSFLTQFLSANNFSVLSNGDLDPRGSNAKQAGVFI